MMETRLHAQLKTAPPPSFTPVRNGVLQRKCACGGSSGVTGKCEDCERQKFSLQRSTENSERSTRNSEHETRNSEGVPPIVHEVLRSPGQPLDAETRTFFEPRFGHDFSRVQVHSKAPPSQATRDVPTIVNESMSSVGRSLDTDTRSFFESKFGHDFSSVRIYDDHRAASSARTLLSHAFTVGNNIVFAGGRYAPHTPSGKQLLGHELAHVVQQGRGGVSPKSASDVASLEGQADAAASAALAGSDRVNVSGAAPSGLQMNAEAYVWEPHVDGFGHAAIKLCDGTYISWWPVGSGDTKEQVWSGVPGGPNTYADDIGPGGEGQAQDATYDLGCNCLDEAAIKTWYDANFASNPNAKWAVLKNSCSDVAHQALNVGSSLLNPCYASISHSKVFWTPKDLGAYADCQSRWCQAKAVGPLTAAGRYLWENVKEIAGGWAYNTLQGLWWKGEIIGKSLEQK